MAMPNLLANGSGMPAECCPRASPTTQAEVDSAGARCFQVMEAPHLELLNLWTSRWDDLVDFEIIPVLTSTDFWSTLEPEQT